MNTHWLEFFFVLSQKRSVLPWKKLNGFLLIPALSWVRFLLSLSEIEWYYLFLRELEWYSYIMQYHFLLLWLVTCDFCVNLFRDKTKYSSNQWVFISLAGAFILETAVLVRCIIAVTRFVRIQGGLYRHFPADWYGLNVLIIIYIFNVCLLW